MSSADSNKWDGKSVTGAVLGFAVFGCAYIATVISIILDIRKSSNSYDQLIAEDHATMKNLGLSNKMAEFEAELQIRLSGKKMDNTGDDQLLGEAQKLTRDQYAKYM